MYNQKIDDKELDCFFNINTNDYNNHINLNKIQIDTILNIKQDLFSYFIENIKKYLEKLENQFKNKYSEITQKYICS